MGNASSQRPNKAGKAGGQRRYSPSALLQAVFDPPARADMQDQVRFTRMLEDPHATPVLLTLDFLKGITSDFSEERVLGHGGFGVVYKGVLRNGRAIAVKRLKILETNLNDGQYQKELQNLSGLDHENIVKFKGYCAHSSQVLWPESQSSQGSDKCILAEIRERILCFEYVSNKSLREQISDPSCGLEWHVRYEIIKGICSGLHYLHMKRDLAHMDLKPENILLDDNMNPKIADFGTSRLFGENESRIITQNSVGSWGYMAPEYLNQGMVSKKADIFSLGVIILELLTGSKSDYPQRKEFFREFTKDVVKKWSKSLVDARYSQQVRTCVSIALNCVDANRDRRPTTECIMKKLNEVQDPCRSSPSVQKTLSQVAVGVGVVVLILLNPRSSWSCLVMILKVVSFAVYYLFFLAVEVCLVFELKNCSSSRKRVFLFAAAAVLAAILVLLPSRTSTLFTQWSWGLTTMFVIMAWVIFLLAIGVYIIIGVVGGIFGGILEGILNPTIPSKKGRTK